MLLWATLFAVIAYFIYVIVIKPHKYWKNKNVPYLKQNLLYAIKTYIIRTKPMSEVLNDVYKSSSGRYIGFCFFLRPVLMINDIDLIKQITIRDFDYFADHRNLYSEDVDQLFGKNLFSLRGQQWRKMRATLSPAFTGSKMRGMFNLMSEIAEQFTNHFLKELGPDDTLTVEMKNIFSRTANDIIATTAFGINCNSFTEKNNEFYLKGKDAASFDGVRSLKLLGYDISPSLMKLLQVRMYSDETGNFFKNIIVNNIATREEKDIVRPDMIHLLMEARKNKLKHEENVGKDNVGGFATVEESNIGKAYLDGQLELNDDEVTAQALLFFIAGFDSISIQLSHTSYEIALNEDIQGKLHNEIDAAWKESNNKPIYETINNLKYLDMVVSEGLRLWPPITLLDRLCTTSYTIKPERPNENPVNLSKNDSVFIPVYGIHRDPKYYPNPNKFDPERFNEENKNNIKPFTYLPFGIGPRNCIGSRFALLESKIVLFYLLRKFNLVVVNKTEIPLKIARSSFNMNAENGFWLGLQRR